MKTSIQLWIFGVLLSIAMGGYIYTYKASAECIKETQYYSDIAWIRSALEKVHSEFECRKESQ